MNHSSTYKKTRTITSIDTSEREKERERERERERTRKRERLFMVSCTKVSVKKTANLEVTLCSVIRKS